MADFKKIKQMIEFMDEQQLEEFELEEDGVRVRLKKPLRQTADPMSVSPVVSVEEEQSEEQALSSIQKESEESVVLVKSPIVGTFYSAADPDAKPYVEIGSIVSKGQVLCIIEAMKLMNEIDAEQDGEITSIFVETGQPVQYGEKLFAIKPM